jgi:hypothetical protein
VADCDIGVTSFSDLPNTSKPPCSQMLPFEPFRYYQYGERTVHIDGCVELEAAYHGAPPGWIGRKVDVQWDVMFVRLLDPRTGELLCEHLSGMRFRITSTISIQDVIPSRFARIEFSGSGTSLGNVLKPTPNVDHLRF